MNHYLQYVPHFTADYIALLVIFVASVVYAYRSGVGRLITFCLSLIVAHFLGSYIASAIYIGPVVSSVETGKYGQLILFVALTILSYFALSRIVAADMTAMNRWVDAILGALGTTALIATLWVITPATMAVWQPSASLLAVFAVQYIFWWLFFSFVILGASRSQSLF